MPDVPILTTARLTIRPFTEADAEDCRRLSRAVWDSELSPDWLPWASRNLQQLMDLYQPPYGDRAVVLTATGEMVGQVGLVPSLGPFCILPGFSATPDDPRNRLWTPEVGLFWMLDPAHRGDGYATEAAEALIRYASSEYHLRRIVATTEHTNTDSQAVMRRLGMRLEHNPYPEPEWFQVVGVWEMEASSLI